MKDGKARKNSSIDLDALVLLWEFLIHINTDIGIVTDVICVCILIHMYVHVYTYIFFFNFIC